MVDNKITDPSKSILNINDNEEVSKYKYELEQIKLMTKLVHTGIDFDHLFKLYSILKSDMEPLNLSKEDNGGTDDEWAGLPKIPIDERVIQKKNQNVKSNGKTLVVKLTQCSQPPSK